MLRPFVVLTEVNLAAPLVGITTNRNQNDFGFPQFSVNQAYISALSNAGAAPLMIPLGLPGSRLDDLLARLDGIVFSGGGDIHPENYGSPMHPTVKFLDVDRDRVELHLVDKTIQQKLPFLGICRGLQVINVGLGGTLYEDILVQRPDSLEHSCFPKWPRHHLAHPIEVAKNSLLGDILATGQLEVNSLHHQGIKRLAVGVQATAWAPDKLIEAFEMPDYPFGLAVQWHPEHIQEHQPMQVLFKAFVNTCKKD